jgi:hypothetical protein
MDTRGAVRRLGGPLIAALLAACAASCSGDAGAGDGRASTSPRATGPMRSVEQSRALVLGRDRVPPGLDVSKAKPSDPLPGAEGGWRGGWTSETLVAEPGAQAGGWQWAQSTASVYADAASAARALDAMRTYVVSTYAGHAREIDPALGDESVAVEGSRGGPDATVMWRENNVIGVLAAYGGAPLTDADIVGFAKRLSER